MFLNSEIFVDKKITLKWYSFIFFSSIGSLLFFIDKKRSQDISIIQLILVTLSAYCLCRSSIYGISVLDLSFFFSALLLYLLFKSDKDENITTDSIFLLIVFIQAVYGLLQYFTILPTNDTFRILGSYANPAGIAACLTAVFPLAFTFIRKYKVIIFIFIFIILIVIIISGSRAGVLSLFIISALYLSKNLPECLKQFRSHILYIIITLIISISIYLFFLKKDSAIGRTLIWQVTTDLIRENIFIGGGSYNFYKSYMIHQAEYFNHNRDSMYGLLAGNVMHPFNEYLLLVAKYGFSSMFLLGLAAAFIMRKVQLYNPYVLCIISISIFSLFSYPLQYPFIWVILIYCIVQIDKRNQSVIFVSKKWTLIFLTVIVTSNLYLLFRDVQFEFTWNNIAQQSLNGDFKEVRYKYRKLYKSWNGNHLFLYNYAAELAFAAEYTESNKVLDQTILFWNDYDIQMLYADNYAKLGEDTAREKHLKIASNMCPNRFLPLFNLHELYVQNNRIQEALELAKYLLVKEVKIPSPTVFSIKNKMKQYVERQLK
ncbi:O-antigen ligase family protein [Sphingobacterium siyangense]|uniref:O-antigen ligase family protein n=1 Tax=Sphingobacterium siyangense TaxID=459529 RepID=UPI002FDA4960